MATYTKPTKVPGWALTGTRTEPSAGKKNTGWLFEESPPYNFFNWLQGIGGDWLSWIDERLEDGATADDLRVASGFDLEIGDQYFNLGINTDPQIVFDDQAGTDRIYYDRSANVYHWEIGGVDAATLGPTSFLVASNIYANNTGFGLVGSSTIPSIWFDNSAGGTIVRYVRASKRWDNYIDGSIKSQQFATGYRANRFYGYDDLQTPLDNTDLVARHSQNAVVCRGRMLMNAFTSDPTLIGDHFNVLGVSRISTGRYLVTYDIPVDVNSSVLIGTLGMRTGNASTGVRGSDAEVGNHSTGSFTVEFWDINDTLADPVATSLLMFTVTGRPNVLPTPY